MLRYTYAMTKTQTALATPAQIQYLIRLWNTRRHGLPTDYAQWLVEALNGDTLIDTEQASLAIELLLEISPRYQQ